MFVNTENYYELISCIIPTYNKFDYIYRTIQSVLIQSYPYIELIITDDGSLKFPKEEIERYIESHKRDNIRKYQIIIHKENMGTVKNINYAVKWALGKYIVPLSGDDVFRDNNTILTIISRMKEMNWDHMVCRRMLCSLDMEPVCLIPTDSDIKKIDKMKTLQQKKEAFACQEYYNMASGSVFYYTKEFLTENGFFDETYKLWEDGPFFYKILKKNIPLNMEYGIVSINYIDGGVSSKNVQNSYLLADEALFYKRVLDEDGKTFSKKKLKLLKFIVERKNEYPKYSYIKKILFVMRNINIIIYRRLSVLIPF